MSKRKPDKTAQANALYRHGLNLLRRKEFARALADFSRVIELEPAQFKAYFSRGRVYQVQRKYQASVEDFSRVLRLQPDHTSIYKVFYHRGRALAALDLYQKAIADFSRVIRMQPRHVKAYYHRGLVFFWGCWDLAAAIQDFSSILEIDPHNLEALLIRGLAHTRRAEPAKAVHDYCQVIKLNPEFFKKYQQDLQTAYLPDVAGLQDTRNATSVTLSDVHVSMTFGDKPAMHTAVPTQ
jgi:tetratricopeptide (TPR) repeat protein